MRFLRSDYLVIVVSISFILSCTKREIVFPVCETIPGVNVSLSELSSSNPYSLENMQKAYESLMADVATKSNTPDSLDATDYYVCFTPADSVEYKNLMELDLELFDYPLVEDKKLMASHSMPAEVDSSALDSVL